MEVYTSQIFVTGILYNFGNDTINYRMYFSSIGIEIGDGNIIKVWLGYWKVLVMGIIEHYSMSLQL